MLLTSNSNSKLVYSFFVGVLIDRRIFLVRFLQLRRVIWISIRSFSFFRTHTNSRCRYLLLAKLRHCIRDSHTEIVFSFKSHTKQAREASQQARELHYRNELENLDSLHYLSERVIQKSNRARVKNKHDDEKNVFDSLAALCIHNWAVSAMLQ